MAQIVSNINNHELEIISLYLSDYKREIHVREIARLLNANHRTIGLTVEKLKEKQVMNLKKIGKNNVYSLNIQNITTREYITCAESLQKIKILEKHFFFKKLLTELSQIIETEPIVLFGSYAKGKETKESDIDILLFKGETEIEAKIKSIAKQYNKSIQVQQATREQFETGIWEKDPLIIEIVNNHIILNNNQFFIGMLWRYAHER
ncbi:MAG: nucleotidyltransferase domain-containing protein [Candidatus Woesearchaeota archaeon]|jgi:predicted nucleotidyltransferase